MGDTAAEGEMPEWERVLDFWFGTMQEGGLSPRDELWFGAKQDTDTEVRRLFGPLVSRAMATGLEDWGASSSWRPLLAATIVLDQFPRMIFRRKPAAFACDGDALTMAQRLLSCETFLLPSSSSPSSSSSSTSSTSSSTSSSLPLLPPSPLHRLFAIMPLQHCERAEIQAEAVRHMELLFAHVGGGAPTPASSSSTPSSLGPYLQECLSFARQHQQVVRRFDRFPHRNQALGRSNTNPEEEYLTSADRWGQ